MKLKQIAKEIRSCTLCPLHRERQHAVPGEGPGTARIVLMGEAPGREEDLSGKPFVGRSGKLLDRLIAEAGLAREEMFITSVVKCRPPKNRAPLAGERNTCLQAHGMRQLRVIRPQIVCLLGAVASNAFLGTNRLGEVRGRTFKEGDTLFLSTYHPAAAMRNPAWKGSLLEDLKRLTGLKGAPTPGKILPTPGSPRLLL